MLPIIPTLAFALLSFLSSAFIILRIVIPILPPHPLSRRVPPSEFGLPNFRKLSPADKSHIWLASLDIVALGIFIWQALYEYYGGPSGLAVTSDPGSVVRMWIATTVRQSCLLIVAGLTLAHVRMGRSVAFGKWHWMICIPTILLTVVPSAVAGTLAGAGVASFFWGLLSYSVSVAILSSAAFGCLIGTLVIIKRNLATLNDIRDPWPPANAGAPKPRASFDTADVDGLKEGSSWITSQASSQRDSISAFSFSTNHTAHSRGHSNASSRLHVNPAALLSNPSLAPKSNYWFAPSTPGNGRTSPVPPVPPLPALYRTAMMPSFNIDDDPDPFRAPPRPRVDSQTSWLTEPSVYQPTLSAWSFPTSCPSSPNHLTPDSPTGRMQDPSISRLAPAMVSTDVLGGYGYAPEISHVESGTVRSIPSPGSELDVSVYRAIGWLVTIWVPMVLAVPYYVTAHPQFHSVPTWASYLLIISVTMSSPLLASNILFRSPLPIPSGLFDSPADPPLAVLRAPSTCSTYVHEYKRSATSITVVESCRSGDVWLAKGDAVEGKGKIARALGLLHPKPKLAVLPQQEEDPKINPLSPTLPIQYAEEQYDIPPTLNGSSMEMGVSHASGSRKKDSKASSYWSGTDDNTALATQIMIAERHFSTLAMTMVLPPSPERRISQTASGEVNEMAASTSVRTPREEAGTRKPSGHLRARSVSSITSIPHSAISGPPSTPLPPTPPAVRYIRSASAAKRNMHRRSLSSTADEFSFGPITNDDATEIDALSAGMLPLLIPGIKVGNQVRGVGPTSFPSRDGASRASKISDEADYASGSSDHVHSRPKTHKRHHFSLPSLNLSKDSFQSFSGWRADPDNGAETKLAAYEPVPTDDDPRRKTVHGGGRAMALLDVLKEEDEASRRSSPSATRPQSSAGYSAILDVPQGIDVNRNSFSTLISALDKELQMVPLSATSDDTLLEFRPDFDVLAESTPHEFKIKPRRFEEAPPVPKLPPKTRAAHRSGMTYIRSDENTPPISVQSSTDSSYSFAPQPTVSIRPLATESKVYKSSKKLSRLQNQENVPPSSSSGLRSLSLLQNRESVPVMQGTKPLTIRRKNKKGTRLDGESVRREPSPKKHLKPLKLVRNETTKEREVLREQEVIPSVVVRPPSSSSHHFSLPYTSYA